MKIVPTALAFAIASPALAQSADPHANHKAAPAAAATPAQAEHVADTMDCCADKPKDCCKDMQAKGCCDDKAKGGAESHAGHQGH